MEKNKIILESVVVAFLRISMNRKTINWRYKTWSIIIESLQLNIKQNLANVEAWGQGQCHQSQGVHIISISETDYVDIKDCSIPFSLIIPLYLQEIFIAIPSFTAAMVVKQI